MTALLETEGKHQTAQRLFRKSCKSKCKIQDVKFCCPVLNFEYCSLVLGCRFPRKRPTNMRKQKRLLLSGDTILCLHTTFLIVPLCFLLVFQQLMSSTFMCCIAHNNEASGTLWVLVSKHDLVLLVFTISGV